MSTVAPQLEVPLHLHVSDSPYENYFYADRVVSCHAILASPLPRAENGSPPQHRLLFAWPAGNSGAAAFFKAPGQGNESLNIRLKVGRHGRVLDSIRYEPGEQSLTKLPSVGVSGLVEFSNNAVLSLAILGSVRTLRDYTEGHGILNSKVQAGIQINALENKQNGIKISRVWFDGTTTTHLTFCPATGEDSQSKSIAIAGEDSEQIATFAPGLYSFQAHFNYPQISYTPANQLLRPAFHHLIQLKSDAVKSLSFLSQSNKILAGAWRFLTYFGRDSMISLLLLNPILSEGEHGVLEVGLSAALERIDQKDGSVCHEENIGDYPAAQAALNGNSISEAQYDYKMIDTDFFLPILTKQYLIESPVGQKRLESFLGTHASLIPANAGKTYGQLLTRTCGKILTMAKAFSQPGGHTSHKNLISLQEGQPVGQWRDSNDGLGGGRYPYDVNTCLMPAALRAIGELARAGVFKENGEWGELADERAGVWETFATDFFTSSILQDDAKGRLERYKQNVGFAGPSRADQIDEDLCSHALALREDGSRIEIMHTDASFRLLLLPHLIHSPNPIALPQHLQTLDALTSSILRTFPAGLFTPVGILIANPAYSTDPSHARTFTTGAYHGTVIWSWNSLAMLAKGLEVQFTAMATAEAAGNDPLTAKSADPGLYTKVRAKMKRAYTRVWDCIEANEEYLSAEVWSWRWDGNAQGNEGDGKGGFVYVPLSHLPTPDGAGQTESNVRQLWSLTLLALERRRELEA